MSKSCSGLLCLERPIYRLAYLGENLLHECTCWLNKSSTTLSFSPVPGHVSIWSAKLAEVKKKLCGHSTLFGSRRIYTYIMRLRWDKPREKWSMFILDWGHVCYYNVSSGLALLCRGILWAFFFFSSSSLIKKIYWLGEERNRWSTLTFTVCW